MNQKNYLVINFKNCVAECPSSIQAVQAVKARLMKTNLKMETKKKGKLA